MIVKDEANAAIESVGSFVDEIILVGEKKVLEKYLKKASAVFYPDKIKVYDYKWKNDFADARNFADSKATNDIIFWIDADDTVINPENLPKLAELIEKGDCDWINLQYLYEKDEQGNVLMRQYKPRLYRKGTGVWKKSVHEVLEPTKEVGQIISDDVTIDHHTDPGHKDKSGERNLKILMEEYTRDGDKTDPRTLYYLGNTLMAMGRFKEAVPFYTAHIKVCGWPEEKYFSMHYLAHCLKWIGQLDAAINVALEMTKVFPQWSLAYFDLAEFYSDKEDYKRVIEWVMTGLTKQKPDSKAYFTSDLDYTVMPMSRLAEAYMFTLQFDKALQIADRLLYENPKDPLCKELYKQAKKAFETEKFVNNFVGVATVIGNYDRIKASRLFEALPGNLDEDIRIQQARFLLVPPKTWDDKSIVIYCGKGNGEKWAYPSIFSGIGGSEEAVINMSQQLTKLGYKVTVFNDCGDLRGIYSGVEYVPYYHFNMKDNYNTLIAWRTPGLFNYDLKAKKKYVWLHDLAFPQQFSEKVLKEVDKFIFLSKFHRGNMPSIPDNKVFISNNGINPKDFEKLPEKRPNSVFWGSSYDRGLLCLVRDIMPLVRKQIPNATLDVCYGWNNIDREIKNQPGIYPDLEALKAELEPLLHQDWIIHHGRVSHAKLHDIMGSCMVHAYPSEFGETNNITAMKSQAAGCYLVTTSQAGATPEKVRYGEIVEGDSIYTNKKLQEEFSKKVVTYLKGLEHINTKDMRKELGKEFSWEATASSWQKGLL